MFLFFLVSENDEDEDEDDYDEEEDETKAEYIALFKQLTRTARFAIPDDFEEDDEYDDVYSADWKEYSDDERTLEGLGTFQGIDVN